MAPRHSSNVDLFKALQEEVAAWEASPYYLAEDELFDLERFLKDRGADDLCLQLEQVYGRPLNISFWKTLLPYHKLRRLRLKIRQDEAEHDRKRALYLESVNEARRTLRELLEMLAEEEKKPRLHLVRPPDSSDAP
ncbi:hypothetical protein [Desulfosoma caldarium]|uniref:Uncharacterized protein n=1 Tax=Desulfosoma caldarium TaxID=610254 RepID=A0A3N1VNU9_9BACT|nr:hypothetical protein [Desulfosoma caldarium]ROR01587.1 hypothetical protein EDC27_0766 [Desulfosoma caldarium]